MKSGQFDLEAQAEIPKLDPGYLEQVSTRLTAVLRAARKRPERPVGIDAAKIVIFSDHHKGGRDGADDFQRCERAYCAALGYYAEAGFTLFVLGDAEELWEESPGKVLSCYSEVLQLEAEFRAPEKGGLERFFGNHDDLWEDQKQVNNHLETFFGDLRVRESLLLPLTDGNDVAGELFFVHGHQGTTESDKYGRWARLPVRYLWRPLQRKLGFSATTPASDFGLRGKHDYAMFEWTRRQRATRRQRTNPPLVLISGHTHRPVFSLPDPPPRRVEQIEAELVQARDAAKRRRRSAAKDASKVGELRAELENALARRRDRQAAPLTVKPPCYFNSGCCSFPDGDVTGLEIENGEIRLVRWPDDQEQPRRRELGCKPLREVFEQVRDTAPEDTEILELAPP